MSSIVGNIYDNPDLARATGGGEEGYHDPLGCGWPWPWWCVLAVTEQGDALLASVVREPLREFHDAEAGDFNSLVDVLFPDDGTVVECVVDHVLHRPVRVVTAGGKRWHVLAGCSHWRPARDVGGGVIDHVLPDPVEAAYRAAGAPASAAPGDDSTA